MDTQNNHQMPCSSTFPTQTSAVDLHNADEFSFAINSPETTDNITPSFPLFNRDLVSDPKSKPELNPAELRSESTSSTSSSDSLGIDPDSYCVWNADRTCKKSASTGSRLTTEPEPELGSESVWRIIMRRRRSVSGGKDKFESLNSFSVSSTGSKLGSSKPAKKVNPKEMNMVTAHKVFYGKEKNGNKTFLPYKQDLVGLWSANRRRPFDH